MNNAVPQQAPTLSPEERARMEARAMLLGTGDCTRATIKDAQEITDPDVRSEDRILPNGSIERGRPGHPHNGYALLPQLLRDRYGPMLADVSNTTQPRGHTATAAEASAILRPDGEINEDEITAALIIASQLANRRHIKLEDVPMEDIAPLMPEMVARVKEIPYSPSQGGR